MSDLTSQCYWYRHMNNGNWILDTQITNILHQRVIIHAQKLYERNRFECFFMKHQLRSVGFDIGSWSLTSTKTSPLHYLYLVKTWVLNNSKGIIWSSKCRIIFGDTAVLINIFFDSFMDQMFCSTENHFTKCMVSWTLSYHWKSFHTRVNKMKSILRFSIHQQHSKMQGPWPA